MSTGGGEKRPPWSPLESQEKGRKMDGMRNADNQDSTGVGAVDNSVIITEIRNSLPSLMHEIMDANMAAMEERLTTTISNMTLRLEGKIDSANLSLNERMENIETVQEGFSGRLQDFKDRVGNVENIAESNSGLHDLIIALAKRVVRLEEYRTKEEENQYLRSRVEELERQFFDVATELRDKRICISGIKDTGNESPKKAVVRTLNQLANKHDNPTPAQSSKHQNFIQADDIDIAYRTGKKIGKNPQNIVVHLKWSGTKMRIMGLKKKLVASKQTKHFISDDIPFEVRSLRQKLKNINESAKKQGIESRIVGNKLSLNGKIFTSADLDGLSDDLIEGAAQIKEVKGGLAYRGEAAFLSNFYPASFSIDDHEFANVEQFYQYKKCLTLGEINMAAKNLRTSRPLQAKALGDKYEDSSDWNEIKAQCMLNGTMAKYTQNANLALKLIDTGENGLYEATTDRFFAAGIGLGSKTWSTGEWSGHNAAGKISMNVRNFLTEKVGQGVELDDMAAQVSYPVLPSSIPNAIKIIPDEEEGSVSTSGGEADDDSNEVIMESDGEDENSSLTDTDHSQSQEASQETSQVITSQSGIKNNKQLNETTVKVKGKKSTKPGKNKKSKKGSKSRVK